MENGAEEREEAARRRLACIRDYVWTVTGILTGAFVLVLAYQEFIGWR